MNVSKLAKILGIGALAFVVILTATVAFAALYDIEQTSFAGRAASLTLAVNSPSSDSANKDASWNLGNNIVPGQSGEEILEVTNGGTISGIVCYSIVKMPPSFLKVWVDGDLCGTTLQPGETRQFKVYWEIPAEEDLGTGGQEFDFALNIELRQD